MHRNDIVAVSIIVFGGAIAAISTLSAARAGAPDNEITSTLINTEAGEKVLIQEVRINASLSDVWNAFVTDEGWMAWAAPVVKVDLRVGGTIRTHYNPTAKIGDPGTNVLHIVNYVPERVLTLRAETSDRWPAIMKKDAKNLMNVLVFESVSPKHTKVLSYGVGYRDTPEYTELLTFFIPANEGLYLRLKGHLEGKKRAESVVP